MSQADFVVPGMHCAGCLRKIERGLPEILGVMSARANLSTKRVHVDFDEGRLDNAALVKAFESLGFDAAPFKAALGDERDVEDKQLLRAMAVAGFAAANIMLLSVSVWAGLVSDMDAATREMFHWISALIAFPALAYAGRPFFISAFKALRAGTMNMDVPISLAVILASAASLFETIRGGPHVYFDASVSLVFFLLIGRYLDRRARSQAFEVARNLLALRSIEATRVDENGKHHLIESDAIEPGMVLFVAPGMRVPADGVVLQGTSDMDTALLTGETVPEAVKEGSKLHAGTLNLTGALTFRVEKAGEDTLLAEIVQLMEAAEEGGGAYVRLADRLARAYAPLVHVLAGLTFAGWLVFGPDWHVALMACVAVLIITCPCALGLAVPVVQVVGAGKLLQQGVLMRRGDALERLAQVDTVVFDKTGTLTKGAPQLVEDGSYDEKDLALAAALGRHSKHPLAKAIAAKSDASIALDAIQEFPGNGIEAIYEGENVRLGRKVWVCGEESEGRLGPELWLKYGGMPAQGFHFTDELRDDAKVAIDALKAKGLDIHLLSGDRESVARHVGALLGIEHIHGDCRPDDKIRVLQDLKAQGRKVLMVGDGLNDAPALKTAFASISPASAADLAQASADFVFQGEALMAVPRTLSLMQKGYRLIRGNFVLALGYNLFAIPLAMAGYVTPLIAALAMSSSSILVTLNAMRLKLARS
ncbi:MAG: heavy metal translocating P-type ATPase [Sphingomonadales bacterium]|jgi:Cu2+-exporting ATPase